MSKKRDLHDDEQALWDEVTRHVRRLKAPAADGAPAQGAALRKPRKDTAPTPLPSPRAKTPIPSSRPSGFGIDGATAERLKRGKVEPDARLDLHGLTQAQAHARLFAFVRRGHERGERCLLVITGKGPSVASARDDTRAFAMPERPRAGILRTLVPRWLEESEIRPFVVGVQTAHRRHGGGGALYVYLRRRRGG